MIVLSWARRRLAPFFTLPWVPKSLIGLVTFVALLVIATLPYVPERQVLRSGDVAKKDIEAPRTVDYIDPEQTAIRRRIAAGRVEPVYRESPDATAAARIAVTTAFEAIARVHAMTGLTEAERATRLRQQAGVPLSPAVAAAALTLAPAASVQARAATLATVERVMGVGVRMEQLDEAREQLRELLRASGLTGRALAVASAVGQGVLRANLVLDRAFTQTLRREAEEAVEPVRVRILRGEIIVRRGDRITETHLRKLEALGLTVVLRPRLALFSAAVLSILIGLIATSDLRTAFIAFTGSVVGVYAIRRISHRTDLIVAGLKVGLATAAAVIATGLLERQPVYPAMVVDASSGIFNGVIVGLFSIGIMPYLENLFGLVTPIKLLELSNPAHPLLRRLQLEAPGTYHHSVIVGNLAEAAAEAIGADALLVRVGTYYHDIGKIRRPVFFVENQVGVDNPHER